MNCEKHLKVKAKVFCPICFLEEHEALKEKVKELEKLLSDYRQATDETLELYRRIFPKTFNRLMQKEAEALKGK